MIPAQRDYEPSKFEVTVDPLNPDRRIRICQGCGGRCSATRGRPVPKFCTTCYRKKRAATRINNTKGSNDFSPNEKLGLRVAMYRLSTQEALWALMNDKTALAIDILRRAESETCKTLREVDTTIYVN